MKKIYLQFTIYVLANIIVMIISDFLPLSLFWRCLGHAILLALWITLVTYDSDSNSITVKPLPIKKGHIPPMYYRYHGGFWHINKCSKCPSVGMFEDLHLAQACPAC